MRGAVLPLLLLVGVLSVLLYAYTQIRPALFVCILSSGALAGFSYCLTPAMRRRIGLTPALVAITMPVLAWLLPNAWLLYATMICVVPLFAYKREEVAPIYLFALLLLPGLDLTVHAGSLKLFEYGVHDALATGATLRLLMRPGRGRVPLRLDMPFIAMLLMMVTAISRDTSITNFLRVLLNGIFDCALPYFIVSRSVRSLDDLRLCMAYLTAAACVLCCILLYEARVGWPIYNMLNDHYHIPVQLTVKLRGGVMRAGGPFLESTSIAMVLAFCLMAAWLSRPIFRSTFFYLGTMALLLLGMTAPQSRGAWIGLIIGTLVADLYRRRVGSAVRRVAIMVAVVASLVAIAPMSPYLTETLGLSGGSADTVDYRQRLFDRGMEEFRKSPIVGYSQPQILIHLADLRQGEGIVDFVNTYIYFMLIAGIVGLSIFVGAFLFYLSELWRWRPRAARGDADAAPMALVFAGLAMPMEMLVFTSFGGRPEVFVFLFFAFAAAIVASEERRAVAARKPRPARAGAQMSGSRIAVSP